MPGSEDFLDILHDIPVGFFRKDLTMPLLKPPGRPLIGNAGTRHNGRTHRRTRPHATQSPVVCRNCIFGSESPFQPASTVETTRTPTLQLRFEGLFMIFILRFFIGEMF